jgi:homospermidine synthase
VQRAHEQHTQYATLPGRLLILGFGSVGTGVLPLLLRHLDVEASSVTLLTAPDRGPEALAAAARYGTHAIVVALTPSNYEEARARAWAGGLDAPTAPRGRS